MKKNKISNLTYITSNKGKYYSVKERASHFDINIKYENIDIEELEINDLLEIAKDKTLKAYKKVKEPCFTIDCGFYIEDYPNNPGYPGAFVKRSGVSNNIEKLIKDLENVTNRRAIFKDCLVFYDGKDFYDFWSISKGLIDKNISSKDHKLAKSRLWQVYIPDGYNKPLSEFTEKEIIDRSITIESATTKFLKWYTSIYIKPYINTENSNHQEFK